MPPAQKQSWFGRLFSTHEKSPSELEQEANDVWQRKSDDEVLAAAASLTEYTEIGQKAILLEAERRRATAPKTRSPGDPGTQKVVQGILIVTQRPLAGSHALLQQVLGQQRVRGHKVAPNFLATTRVGHIDDHAYLYATVRTVFAAFGGDDLMDRTRSFPFQAPDGNDGHYLVLFDRP